MKYNKLVIIFSYLREHLDLCYQNSAVFLYSSSAQCNRKVIFIKQEQERGNKTLLFYLTINLLYFKLKTTNKTTTTKKATYLYLQKHIHKGTHLETYAHLGIIRNGASSLLQHS